MPAKRVYTAKALLLDANNRILVLTGGDWPERPDRSHKPDFPGGMIENGESPTLGLVREISEETGLMVPESALTLLYTETKFHNISHDSVTKHLYIARVDDTAVTLSWEHEAYEWLEFANVCALEWRPFHRDALDYVKRHQLLDEFTHALV